MPTGKAPWFVVERSAAVAKLLLTSRKDLSVRSETKKDYGVDLLVEINEGEPLSTRFFVVQVKGATSSDQKKELEGVKEHFPLCPEYFYAPACVFVVDVRDKRSQYAWLAEPLVEDHEIKLKRHPGREFHDLNESAVDEIVNRVKAWYSAIKKAN